MPWVEEEAVYRLSLDAELECDASDCLTILLDGCGIHGMPIRSVRIASNIRLGQLRSLSFGVAMPSGEWLGSRTDEGRAKLR
jgi:hypothetical protein